MIARNTIVNTRWELWMLLKHVELFITQFMDMLIIVNVGLLIREVTDSISVHNMAYSSYCACDEKHKVITITNDFLFKFVNMSGITSWFVNEIERVVVLKQFSSIDVVRWKLQYKLTLINIALKVISYICWTRLAIRTIALALLHVYLIGGIFLDTVLNNLSINELFNPIQPKASMSVLNKIIGLRL